MIATSAERIRERAQSVASRIPGAEVVEGQSLAGGGATPEQTAPTWLIVIRTETPSLLQSRLRRREPPVIARIEEDAVVLDLRTVFPSEEEALIQRLQN
jgi:L-seryl-tRNA(Ser) seleniumtransferase